jgi:hypothetical protein
MLVDHVSNVKNIFLDKKIDDENQESFKQIFGDDRRYL